MPKVSYSAILGGKFANGAITAAMAHAYNELASKEERRATQREAAAIYQRFNSYKRKNPGSPIPVNGEELSVLMSVDASTLDQLYDWDADRSYWEYLNNLKGNDSQFFTSYRSDTFRVSGAGRLNGMVTGSTINYYYVGMTAAAQGGSRYSLPAYVQIWNVGQSISRGWSQIQQIGPGTDWAETGYDFYVDGGWD